MSHVFFTEWLTPPVLRRYAGLHAQAESCSALFSDDADLSVRMLADHRWTPGPPSLLPDGAEERAARFSTRIVDAEMIETGRLSDIRTVVASALDARLLPAFRARHIVEHCTGLVSASRSVDVDVVASNPYIRGAFEQRRWPGRVRLHPLPSSSPFVQSLREVAGGQWWTHRRSWLSPWRRQSRPRRKPGKLALLFALAYRSVHLNLPVIERLVANGWRDVLVKYNDLPDRTLFPRYELVDEEMSLEAAAAGWRLPVRASRARWRVDADVLGESPFSSGVVERALQSAWTTSIVQLAKHARVLDVLRPDVVLSFGGDPATAALEVAAESRGVPSVYIPHAFTYAASTEYYLPAKVSLLYSDDCVRLTRHLAKSRDRRLIATGSPTFDALAADYDASTQAPVRERSTSSGTPHIVAAFATWGSDLVTHVHQERLLRVLAEALPEGATLICKLHPGRDAERPRCEHVLGAVLAADRYRVVPDHELSTRQLLAVATVAVSIERSTVLVDALVRGCPAIVLRQPENAVPSIDQMHPARDYDYYCRVVRNAAEMRATIEDLMFVPAARAQFLERRREFLGRMVVCDGHSADRMALAIEDAVAGAPVRRRV